MSAQVAVEQTTRSFPAVNGRWRDVFCIIENAYQDISIADSVCEGIFTFAGQTMGLGTQPNWLSTVLPEDDEWRIEWYKFYYGLDLAHAFGVTGKLKYRQAWEQLVQSWIAQAPVGCDSSDIAARRIQNWIYAWNIFSRGGEFGSDFENQVITHLAAEVRHLRRNLTAERNHRTLELYALLIVALALPEIDHDDLLEFAVAELHRNLLTDVRPDGVHREQSTHYHVTALRSFLGARENALRFGVEFPAGYDERLEKACEFLLHIQRPDGLIPALSDADTGSYSDLLQLAASTFNREDFLYGATAEPCSSFPDGGYFIQRSGWDNGARYLIFDCGPIGDGGHGHYDLLNIEVAANGRPLIVDPGRFTYDDSHWRRQFKGTAAHNTVCVDDLDQMEYRRGKPKGPLAQGRLLERLTAPGLDMLCGEVRSPAYEAIHTRRIFFVAGEYWLIVDSLRGSVPHKYDLRFHLTTEALNHCTRIAGGIRTPDMVLLSLSNNCRGGPPWPPVLRNRAVVEKRVATEGPPYSCSLSHGWISPRYGIKQAAPVVSFVSTGLANTDFYTLIAPRELGAPLPQLQVLSDGHVRVEGIGADFNEVDELSRQGETEPTWRRVSL
ncbi:MAG TPA: alginate lyase family protein [Pyrinomonadaceae bacterium]